MRHDNKGKHVALDLLRVSLTMLPKKRVVRLNTEIEAFLFHPTICGSSVQHQAWLVDYTQHISGLNELDELGANS